MSIFYTQPIDFLSDDPFDHVETLNDIISKVSQETATSHIEDEFLASPTQSAIVKLEPNQWCKVKLILPSNPSPTVEHITSIWRRLSSQHACLRSTLYTNAKSGRVYQRVLRKSSDLKLSHGRSQVSRSSSIASSSASSPSLGPSSEGLPYLSVQQNFGAVRSVSLHIRRALVDGHSLGLLKANFYLLYFDLSIPEAPSFKSYLEHISSKHVDTSHAFWAETLQQAKPRSLLENPSLPTSLRVDRHNAVFTDIQGSVLQQLQTFERRYAFSRRVLFESIWAIVLGHHTRSEEIVFGSVGRDDQFIGSESTIGSLEHTYPVRVSLSGRQKIGHLMAHLQSYHRSASQHAFIGFEDIKQHLHGAPVDTIINYTPTLSAPSTALQLDGFPYYLSINGTTPLRLTLCHDSNVTQEEAETLLSHFMVALESSLAKIYLPNAVVDSIELETPTQRVELVESCRSVCMENTSTITKLFERRVETTPDAIAIEDDLGSKITFAALNRLANQLARFLSIRPKRMVVVCLERSMDMVVALIAILKSGAAYTIIDPDAPQERNAQIIDDCDPALIMVHSKFSMRIHDTRLAEIDVAIRSICSKGDAWDSSNLDIDVTVKDRSYVIYTSGSTGKPKGVIHSHAAATNGMTYHNLGGRERWLLFYNPTFSAAQRTILSTIIHGGTLIVAAKQSIETRLANIINDCRVDALGITPSALSTLKPSQIPNLKQVTLVGEQISEDLVQTWAGHVQLRNTYGLSECAQLNFGTTLHTTSNPRIVGRPSDTTSAYILIPNSIEPCARGTAGELCLAGPQLGTGYLNAEAQTAAVFIDNPFGDGKLYRTGDQAKMHYDGSIEILGRIDFQVKINGQKVEPAEVDRVLLQSSDINACLTVSATINGRAALVTAIVLNAGTWSDRASDVRQYARASLPRYMVPSFWIPSEQLPTNINGKSDRVSLRNKAEGLGVEGLTALEHTPERSAKVSDPKEIKIASIWANVIGIDIGIVNRKSSFIGLGGSSIEAIRAIQELPEVGLEASLEILLDDVDLEQAAALYSDSNQASEQNMVEPFSLITSESRRAELQGEASLQDAYPATPLQESLIPSLVAGETTYTYQRVWDVSHLDVVKLKQCFEKVFFRNDILRTGFVPQGKSFTQVVKTDVSLPWTVSQQNLEVYMNEDLKAAFSLEGPLVRFGLLSDTILVVTMHHVLFDFWSQRFIYQDVAKAYQGLPEITRPQYATFVKHLLSQDDKLHRKYFKAYLKNAEPTLLNHTPIGATQKLERRFDGKLSSSARSLGLTAGVVCYTAWAIVLSKHTSNTDVTFATTISGREVPVKGIASMDGPTLTSVPQRVILDVEKTLLEIANDVRANFFELVKHSQYGMRKALASGEGHKSLFDTMVNFLVAEDNDEQVTQVFKRHGARPVWSSDTTTVEIEELDQKTTVRISSTMEDRRLSYILESFLKAISAILESPSQKFSTLDIIDGAEREHLVMAVSNQQNIHQPPPSLLHARFEAHARHHPRDVAIDWQGEEVITYAELDNRANQLASVLVKSGTKIGDLVPLMLEKSVDTIVAILAVMKAGAGYVPLSPDNPVERNLFIVKDVAAKSIITHRSYVEFGQNAGLHTIVADEIDRPDTLIGSPEVEISPDTLAYVIYTSGSTGLPKGVKLPHRAAASAVESMMVAEGRHQGEWRTLQFANYVFDASVQDIFNTLSSGGTLCMAPTEVLLSDLEGCINRMSVRQAILTPTVARLLDPKCVPEFTTLIVGGEPLPSDVVEMWLSDHKILNVYGPTETSMVVTQKHVTQSARTANIGAPFPTVMAFIVQAEGEGLVPYGAVGELCIAGPQVSDGYVNRDDLTSACFVRNNTLDIDRLYRTGDLARWLPNGEIECLGRKDTQVKIHGHRIELGEVEQAIRKTEIVQNAAVILTHIGGKAHLSAFCIFEGGDSAELLEPEEAAEDVSRLRESLTTLAPYMIPTYVFPMGDFPKLPSRKVDRKALRALAEGLDRSEVNQYAMSGSGPKQPVVAVENEVEGILEELWSDILGIPCTELGREANFQSKGGDSIAAISLSSSARKRGYILGVNDILKFPQLWELATKMKVMDSLETRPKQQFVVTDTMVHLATEAGVDVETDVDYVYPSPPGQIEFLNQGSTENQMWALMAVRRLPSTISLEKWISAASRLTETNDILRTSWLKLSNTEWIGLVLKSSKLDIVTVDCQDDGQAQDFIEKFWQQRFGAGQPLVKYAVLRYPDGACDIAIKMDHAVYDGTSLRVFDEHFKATLTDETVPEHTTFRDFVFHIFESDKQSSLKYWTNIISGKPETNISGLASTTKQPKITAKKMKPIEINLESLTKSCNVTPSTIFQAAYQIWLSRQVASPDVSFDYLISGRNVDLPDPQSINGTLANFLPVRTQIDTQATLGSYLQTTQDEFWTMTEYGNVGLNEIYHAAGLDRAVYGNKTLFLFQPFEPATGQQDDGQRWLVMAKSKVRMYQPYALVVEVAKAVGGAHRLNIMFDDTVYSADDAGRIADEIEDIVENIVSGAQAGQNLCDII